MLHLGSWTPHAVPETPCSRAGMSTAAAATPPSITSRCHRCSRWGAEVVARQHGRRKSPLVVVDTPCVKGHPMRETRVITLPLPHGCRPAPDHARAGAGTASGWAALACVPADAGLRAAAHHSRSPQPATGDGSQAAVGALLHPGCWRPHDTLEPSWYWQQFRAAAATTIHHQPQQHRCGRRDSPPAQSTPWCTTSAAPRHLPTADPGQHPRAARPSCSAQTAVRSPRPPLDCHTGSQRQNRV